MLKKRLFAMIFSAIVASVLMFGANPITVMTSALAQEQPGTAATNTTAGSAPQEGGGEAGVTVRDSIAVLLSGEIVPAGSFIHLYDSTPDAIATGHVAARVPCDENSTSTLAMLTGSAPNLQPTELELIPELSVPGELCLYHYDLISVPGGMITTDVALQNPSEEDVELLSTSTVVIGINKILPGAAALE
jgi:hypothetical protein